MTSTVRTQEEIRDSRQRTAKNRLYYHVRNQLRQEGWLPEPLETPGRVLKQRPEPIRTEWTREDQTCSDRSEDCPWQERIPGVLCKDSSPGWCSLSSPGRCSLSSPGWCSVIMTWTSHLFTTEVVKLPSCCTNTSDHSPVPGSPSASRLVARTSWRNEKIRCTTGATEVNCPMTLLVYNPPGESDSVGQLQEGTEGQDGARSVKGEL